VSTEAGPQEASKKKDKRICCGQPWKNWFSEEVDRGSVPEVKNQGTESLEEKEKGESMTLHRSQIT